MNQSVFTRVRFPLFAFLMLWGSLAQAATVTTTPLQVGGFLDGGFASNDPFHQNYFVGYGTIGGVRSSERRSFFWYHITMYGQAA